MNALNVFPTLDYKLFPKYHISFVLKLNKLTPEKSISSSTAKVAFE